MVNEHEFEPVPGLPAPLPEGETILWQGRPEWRAMARHTMHTRGVLVYFGFLIVWGMVFGIADGTAALDLTISSARLAGLALMAAGLLTLFAWLAARTTLYTITSRRVVMRIGIAFPMAIQIPYSRIQNASARLWPEGTRDIALSLLDGERIAYLAIWPHARPWRFSRPQPSLRSVPEEAAAILADALATSLTRTPFVPDPRVEQSGVSPVPMAA
jgi:hypothetical protein